MAKPRRPARQFRVRFEYDQDGASTLETPDGNPLPGTEEEYAANRIMRLIRPGADPSGARRPATYAEYCAYEGNPARHVVLGAILEERCACCGAWTDARDATGKDAHTAVWGIDFMDDAREAGCMGTVGQADFPQIPGYLADVTQELLGETGLTARQIARLFRRPAAAAPRAAR